MISACSRTGTGVGSETKGESASETVSSTAIHSSVMVIADGSSVDDGPEREWNEETK